MQWTPDQQKVIDKRDDNILVSASAGSGKTAVLVARILAYIMDSKEPVDIDRLLIVTSAKRSRMPWRRIRIMSTCIASLPLFTMRRSRPLTDSAHIL